MGREGPGDHFTALYPEKFIPLNERRWDSRLLAVQAQAGKHVPPTFFIIYG